MVRGRRLGVDVGGTFTDLVVAGPEGIEVEKTPTTPADPVEGVTRAIKAGGLGDRQREDSGAPLLEFFGHGTTVATNAVIEGEWADTALVTTAGFRDVLEIGRQDRPAIYDLHAEKPTPVVPRDRRFEVSERLNERGAVETALDDADLDDLVDRVLDADVDAVAVSLLFAFENAAHEQRVAAALRSSGFEGPISLSSAVRPEIGEYERSQTTALNAALAPILDRYLARLESWVREHGLASGVRVMQSSGGLAATDAIRDRPVTTLLSGPAAGVTGAGAVAKRCGAPSCLTLDMGGTSTDVSLVLDGDPMTTQSTTIGGYTVSVPTVDVHSVGAGGGSIAWVDAGNELRVGPRSAGADPGPVCYGRGGTQPTVTDAQIALGRLSPALFAEEADGGDPIGEGRILEAIDRAVAEPLEIGVTEAARGIVDLATHRMADAIRVVSVERGHDPREYPLVAFGGAGPLHAAALATQLGCDGVIVPNHAGVLSAVGLTASDVRANRSRSMVRRWSAVDHDELSAAFRELEAECLEALESAGVPTEDRTLERLVDCRYVGQDHAVTVTVPGERSDSPRETVPDRFHEAHRERYGHAARAEPVQLVALRVRGRGAIETDPFGRRGTPAPTLADARRETRAVHMNGEEHETPVYEWSAVPTEEPIEGPAIVAGAQSTVLIPPEATAELDADGNVLMEVPS